MLYNLIKSLITRRKSEDNMSDSHLEKLSDAAEGQGISFVYYGNGKNYGQLRHATVLEVLADGVLAQETNNDHPKHFKNTEAYQVEHEALDASVAVAELEQIHGKGVTFVDAKQMLSEAGWANEVVLDSLTTEQLVQIFGAYHTVRENSTNGVFEYTWDAENGNILIKDTSAPAYSVESINHDGTLRYVNFRVTNNVTGSFVDLRITVDQMGKVTLQSNDNVINAIGLTKTLLNLINESY